MLPNRIRIDYKKQIYEWDGRRWFNAKTFESPPKTIVHELERKARTLFEAQDDDITDFQDLLSTARNCKASRQLGRALRLVERAVGQRPDHIGAHAVLCSCLRELNRPQDAVDRTAHLARTDYVPLLTSRAAAYCDLLRWEDAKKTIGRALAIGTRTEDAFLVVARIKQHRPDLYGA